jgi:hypothetical protein
MNKEQRKHIEVIVLAIERLATSVEPFTSELSDMQIEEQEKFDNMTEGLQQSERGQAIEASAEVLLEAAEKCQEAFDALEEASALLGGVL